MHKDHTILQIKASLKKAQFLMHFRVAFLLLFALGLGSCGLFPSPEKTQSIARYGDKELPKQALTQVVAPGLAPKDSVEFAKSFLQQWGKKQSILEHAQQELGDRDLALDDLVIRYRTALIISRFQEQYLNQKMDTSVTKRDIRQYYSEYPYAFQLDEPLVRFVYLKIDRISPNLDSLLFAMEFQNPVEDQQFIVDYAFQFSLDHHFFFDQWTSVEYLRRFLPEQMKRKPNLHESKGVISTIDENFAYLLKVIQTKSVGEKAPLEYVKMNIKELILQQRKRDILQRLEDDIYQKALDEGKFEIY